MNVVLTIAGSDSGGGAGIQADLKTFHQFGVFGTSVVVAVTAQNTMGVTDIHPIPPSTIDAQLEAVVTDLAPQAVKTGMLATRDLVAAVASGIRRYDLRNYVLDPVMVATSGDRLLDGDAESAIVNELLPLATLVTPNLDEARILTGLEIPDAAAMPAAAERLVGLGAGAVLLKGGHLAGPNIVDVFYDGSTLEKYEHPKLDTSSTHGTGCTLSAAVTAQLACGRELKEATEGALEFVHRAFASAPGLGHGNGPLNHFATVE